MLFIIIKKQKKKFTYTSKVKIKQKNVLIVIKIVTFIAHMIEHYRIHRYIILCRILHNLLMNYQI